MTLANRTEVSAILGEEFEELIDALGVKEAFHRRRFTCSYCHDVVDASNVLLVFPKKERQVGFVCTKPECALTFTDSPEIEVPSQGAKGL